MISTYENYLPMEKSLSLEDMVKLHNDMVLEIGSDSDALELYDELVETATRYASFRAQWLLFFQRRKAGQRFQPIRQPQFPDSEI